MPTCQNCNQQFTIYPEDQAFYTKINVPAPTHCPDCRQQRRLAYRNLNNLYLRQCDFTGKQIVSNYSPDKSYKIYDQNIWWSDKWEPLEYGQNFDWSRPFFDQFFELQLKVPRPALLNKNSVNSEYTNHSEREKNCYMCFNVGMSEDMYYCTNYILYSKDCVDCYDMQKGELLYESFSCRECYNSKFLFYCQKCFDSIFLYDCRGCHDCFRCWNLRNAEYCIENKKYSEDEYRRQMAKIYPQTYQDWQKKRQQFLASIEKEAIYKYARIEKSNSCSGSDIINSQSVIDSYYAFESVNCRYCYDIGEMKECYDTYEPWRGELQYECHALNQSYQAIACSICYENNDLTYCEFCHNSKDLFGCIGLRHKQYCILNKQYSEVEYKKLLPKIIEQMNKIGEYGQFFPMQTSPFAYNETVAQEYYPLTKEAALAKGLRWKDEELGEVDPNLPKCISCGRNFKVVPQEVKFYQKNNLPEPGKCWKCRHRDRLVLRDTRRIWDRNCAKCGVEIKSIYSPDRPEKVYCEACYQKEIY
ncbi:MAG: zinc-ribbon domain containing protein [Patescibacteria group bacterium]